MATTLPARLSAGCAVGTLGIAAAALVAWVSGRPELTRLLPAWPRMVPWTAIGLALAAAGVLTQRAPGRLRGVGALLGLAAALPGAVVLAEYVAGAASGIDRLLFPNVLDVMPARYPGRPAPQTALLLFAAGTAVLLLRRDGPLARLVAAVAAGLATAVVAVVLVGYAYGARELFAFTGSTGMALSTAMAGALLCTAVVTARPDRPPMAWLVSDRLDSLVTTRLLPVVAAVPLLARLFDIVGDRLGLPADAREALAELAVAVVLGVLVVHTGHARRRTEQALRASETRYRLLADGATDLVTLQDADGRLTYVSPSAAQVLGYPPENLAGHTFPGLAHPDDVRAVTGWQAAVRHGGVHTLTFRAVRADGGQVWLEGRAWLRTGVGGSEIAIQCSARDVTARHEVEQALAEAEQRFRLAFEDAPTGIALVGLDGRLLHVNAALADLLGATAGRLVGTPVASLTHPDEQHTDVRLLGQLVAGELDTAHRDTVLRHADGSDVPVSLHIALARRPDGSPAYAIAQLADLTERKRLEAELTRRARSDPLTGLPNRALLFDRLTHALAVGRRNGTGVGLLFVDVDDFKQVNDALGHEAGDAVLVAVAERLRTTLRASDSPARLGGDEFVAVCEPVQNGTELAAIRRRVAAALREPIPLPRREPIRVTASIGARLAGPADDCASLLRAADAAMYDAKARRRSPPSDDVPRPRTASPHPPAQPSEPGLSQA